MPVVYLMAKDFRLYMVFKLLPIKNTETSTWHARPLASIF